MKTTKIKHKNTSLLSNEQKAELDKRLKKIENGKMEVFNWDKVYNELKVKK